MISLLKIIYFRSMTKDNLKHPIQAAVAPIIALTLILDAGYLSEYSSHFLLCYGQFQPSHFSSM